MHNILFVGFSNRERAMKGSAYWKGESYYDIIGNSDFSAVTTDNTKRAIGYFTGRDNMDKLCVELHIKSIRNKNNSLYLEYDYLEETEYDSASVKNSLNKVFSSTSANKYIPFCYCLPEEEFNLVIEDESLLKELRSLTSGNQWQTIHNNYFPLEKIKSIPQFWNDAKVLSSLSFASAKLSEVYINLKRSFADNKKSDEFLKMQKRYREETIALRNRCIELEPENPGYYSNLAYTHYQSCRELMLRGGRRDGNLKQEAEKAIEYLKLALDLEPNRITDLYRMGQIKAKILYSQIKFIKQNNKSEANNAVNILREAIICFQKVEEVYEILPEIDEKSLQRYNKEYIKSLYNCADAYHNLQKLNWHYTDYFFQYESNGYFNDTKYIDIAIRYIEKCIDLDNPKMLKAKIKLEPILTAKHNGAVESVYKLYFTGKLNLIKYFLLTNNGTKENLPAEIHCTNAEKYFLAALYQPFSKEMQRMSKGFIAEKLARLYIAKKEYKEAMKTLEKFVNGNYTDYYIRYTYATAAIKAGETQKAQTQIEKALSFPKSNPDIFTGKILRVLNGLNETDKTISDLIKSAVDTGIKNIDSRLIEQAIIFYKTNETGKACKILSETLKIIKSRVSLIRRFMKYSIEQK